MSKYFTYLTCFFLLLGLFGTNTVSATEEIWGEAESADSLTSPFQVVDDPNASGGQYIAAEPGSDSSPNPPSTGIATYTITVEEGGVYRIYLRVRCEAAGDGDDSCWVRMQGVTLNIPVRDEDWINNNNLDYDATDNSEEWFWSQVRHYGAWPMDDYIEMTIDPGTYTLEIAYREDGLLIDGFLITNETDVDLATLPDEIPAAGPEPVDPGTDGLVAHYPMDEGSGDVVADASGNGHDGIILGDPNNCWVEGAPGLQTALHFGTAGCDGVDCNMWDPSADTNELSVACWVKYFSGGTTWQGIVANRTGWDVEAHKWAFELNGGSGECHFGSRGGGSAYGLGTLPEGEWINLAFTFDGATIIVYHDGEEVASGGAGFGPDNNSTVRIGASEASGNIFEGAIDDVRIFNVALSAGEIMYLAGFRAPVDPGTEGLLAYYALEGDVLDSSGNEFHGTIVGDPIFTDGAIGMAMDFNGDDYVDCGNDESFSVTEYLTVALWVNIRTIPTAWTGAVTKGNSAWRISNNNVSTGMHFAFEDGSRGWQAANSATELNVDEWYHVCGVYDINVGAKIYINGVEDGSNPDKEGITQNTSIVAIGTNSDSPQQAWDGLLDEVMIFNRALSAEEIMYLAGL